MSRSKMQKAAMHKWSETEKMLVRFVIMKGHIITKRSYYGGTTCDDEGQHACQKAQDDIESYLRRIVWSKTKPPTSDSHATFAGTFVDHDDYVHAYGTKIVLRNGDVHDWEIDVGTGSSFGEILERAIQFMIENEK